MTRGSYTPHYVENETGFHFLMTNDGGIIWLCPCCFEKASKAANELYSITKSKHVFLGTLLKGIE